MPTPSNLPIVVGVNGTPAAERAMRYAVRRAEQEKCGVLLINAVHEVVPVSPMWPLITRSTLLDIGNGILADSQQLAEQMVGRSVPIAAKAMIGPAVTALADAGETARLIVLGHRGASTLERIFTGATTLGVVARASCPVVSVPREWDEQPARQRIVAGIDGSEISRQVLASAFAMASERGARLDVVHCWELEPVYSVLFANVSLATEWRQHTSGLISALVDEQAARYPDVVVNTHLEYADVAQALIHHSANADAIILGRHGQGGASSRVAIAMPGSVARALIQHAHCPVELIPVTLPELFASQPTADGT